MSINDNLLGSNLDLSNRKYIVFGSGILGNMVIKTLKHLNCEIVNIFDNNISKAGTQLEGIEILNPQKSIHYIESLVVVIAVFSDHNIKSISEQLVNLGYKDIYTSYSLFSYYQRCIMNRDIVDTEVFDRIAQNQTEDKHLTRLGNVSLVITEKCTLKCLDCGVLIPYYKDPKNHDTNLVKKSIQRLSQSVDVIDNLTIIGGEPLIHNDLVSICSEAATMSNILRVTLTTNGTLLPDEKTIQELKKSIFSITISDYGKLSKRKDELIQLLDDNGILYECLSDDNEWSKQNMPIARNRSIHLNNEIFGSCYWVKIAGKVINGQYHLCDFSAAMTPFNGIPNNLDDYVNLLNDDESLDSLRVRMKHRLTSTKCLQACDYCEIYKLPYTERAKQTTGTLNFGVKIDEY